MTADNNLDAWKSFLKGRIAQEQGNEQEALKSFEAALKSDPSNPHFLNSRTIAMVKLNRADEAVAWHGAVAAHVASSYATLARKYVGDNDNPGPWIEGLRGILRDIESAEKGASVKGSFAPLGAVAW